MTCSSLPLLSKCIMWYLAAFYEASIHRNVTYVNIPILYPRLHRNTRLVTSGWSIMPVDKEDYAISAFVCKVGLFLRRQQLMVFINICTHTLKTYKHTSTLIYIYIYIHIHARLTVLTHSNVFTMNLRTWMKVMLLLLTLNIGRISLKLCQWLTRAMPQAYSTHKVTRPRASIL